MGILHDDEEDLRAELAAVKAERERCAVLRVWLLDLSANESDPNEPVADNGATVWDHIRGDARRFAESLT